MRWIGAIIVAFLFLGLGVSWVASTRRGAGVPSAEVRNVGVAPEASQVKHVEVQNQNGTEAGTIEASRIIFRDLKGNECLTLTGQGIVCRDEEGVARLELGSIKGRSYLRFSGPETQTRVLLCSSGYPHGIESGPFLALYDRNSLPRVKLEVQLNETPHLFLTAPKDDGKIHVYMNTIGCGGISVNCKDGGHIFLSPIR
jgi:hypothetical protein